MENIFTSRDDSFYQGVMSRTGGAGVDLVLNSLAGSLLHASWQCVAKFGKMIELGKRDFLAHGSLNMDLFNGNRSFFWSRHVEYYCRAAGTIATVSSSA
jgi:NADPH:quinone reductase and related Zn-dependent oxidoreductases